MTEETGTKTIISQAQATEERVVGLVESATILVDLLLNKITEIYNMKEELDRLSSEEKNRLSNRPEVLRFEEKIEELSHIGL